MEQVNATLTFRHGVHPPERKENTRALPVRRMPFAPVLAIPLAQHIGAPAKPVVKAGEEVIRGQVLAEAQGFVSVPIHAPASGIVVRLTPLPVSSGRMVDGLYLKPFQGSGQVVPEGNGLHPDEATPEQIVEAVRTAGLVGLGGAAFPTHVKLKIPPGKTVDTLIVNGVECEPYLSADHRIMLEETEAIFHGIRYALKATGAARAIIGVEANKPDALSHLREHAPDDLPVGVEAVKVKYPQGAEKMLIDALLKRRVPPGGLPADVGVVVSNVGTMAEMGRLLPKGQGLVERIVTVAGDGVERPGNYRLPVGTPVRFVLEQAGLKPETKVVVLGGPMMGQSLGSLDVPVVKGTSGILAFTEGELRLDQRREFPCIRCGYCVDACPLFLNPSRLGILAKKRAFDTMADAYHLLDCFECGSCSFICPSHIPLVQLFRAAKTVVRERRR